MIQQPPITLGANEYFMLPPGTHSFERAILAAGATLQYTGRTAGGVIENTKNTWVAPAGVSPAPIEGPFTLQTDMINSTQKVLIATGGSVTIIGLVLNHAG